MKKLILAFLTLIIFTTFSAAQDYASLIAEANQFYAQNEYAKSRDVFVKAFLLEAENPSHLYNGACSAALAGDQENGLILLAKSVEKGWTNVRHMKKDSDLDSLHETKEWKDILAAAQKALDKKEANYNKPLQAELLAIYEDDQGIRNEFISTAKELGWEHPKTDSLGKIMTAKDKVNLEKIVKIIDKHGWVSPKIVGNQANSTLFLVIQHADIATQQKYLPMMRQAVIDGNARGSSLALLEDRIALREGRKQTYGSQIGKAPDGKESYVLPLEDPDNVDQRRAEVGLGKIADYVKRWDITWDVETYKKRLPEYIEWNNK